MREIKFRAWKHEIKFRAWEHDVKFMNYQVRISYNHFGDNKIFVEVTDGFGWKDVDEKYLMQFTRLTDKNGKEIYEGDIVRLRSYLQEDIPEVIGRIIFERGSFQVYVDEFEKYNLDSLFMEIEVIGNIYQHKHLLKETN